MNPPSKKTSNRRGGKIMAAYLIFDVEVTDPAATGDYAKLANESLEPFQAKAIVHGGMVRYWRETGNPRRW